MDIHKSQFSELLNLVLTLAPSSDDATKSLTHFLSANSMKEMLANWLHIVELPANITSGKQLLRVLSTQIAHIDDLLDKQLNTILHTEIFQAMEARWRGLEYLVNEASEPGTVKIRVLDITWDEINKDLNRSGFDQSVLFEKIYSNEFGTPGGEPFGLLLGDYKVSLQGKNSRKDIDNMSGLADIATAAFCPFIAGVAPESFGIDCFSDMTFTDNFVALFKQPIYNRWNNFRENINSRFIGLTLPSILIRKPYHNKIATDYCFSFHEDTNEIKQKNYLWGNGCFALGLTMIRSFNNTSWFGHMRGIAADASKIANGLIDQLPIATHDTDRSFADVKFATEIFIDEVDESVFSELGFIAFCTNKRTGHALLYSSMSTYKVVETLYTSADTKISANLQYIMCASRFAHYIKMIGRNKVGTLINSVELNKTLNNWLKKYVATNEVDDTLRAKFPLQDAKVEVKNAQGKPGIYNCIIHLQPRYQLEKVHTALTLVTELAEIST